MTDKLEELPFSEIRSMAKEKGIKFTPKHKKAELILALKTGKDLVEEREIKRAPTMEKHKRPQAAGIITDEVRQALQPFIDRGLKYELDGNVLNMKRDILVCINVDETVNNIRSAAEEAFARSKPSVRGA